MDTKNRLFGRNRIVMSSAAILGAALGLIVLFNFATFPSADNTAQVNIAGTNFGAVAQGGQSAPMNVTDVSDVTALEIKGIKPPGLPGEPPASLNATANNSFLLAAATIATNNVWAVGYFDLSGSTSQEDTLVEHWNGSTWSIIPSPNAGSANRLSAVSAIAANNIWAVGNFTIGGVSRTLIERWNGSSWAIVFSPNDGNADNVLTGVSAISGSDAWAVGYVSINSMLRTLTMHWNGTVWSIVASANSSTSTSQLSAVKAVSSSDVWAAGSYFSTSLHIVQTLVLHWDGTVWSIVASPNLGTSNNALTKVDASSSTHVFFVGCYTNGANGTQALALIWNGTGFVLTPPPSPGPNTVIEGITAVSDTEAWGVGYYSSAGVTRSMIVHWLNNVWSAPAREYLQHPL